LDRPRHRAVPERLPHTPQGKIRRRTTGRALDGNGQNVHASQDNEHGGDGVERRVCDERGKEATRALEQSAQSYRKYQEYG